MRVSILILLALLTASSLYGQEASSLLEPGTTVRVRTRALSLQGPLLRWDADTLAVRTAAGQAPRADHALATTDILGLDRQVPRSRARGAGRGALWGAAVGGVLGAIIGAAQRTDCFLCPESHAQGAMYGAVFFGGVSAGIGAAIGAIVPGNRWERVWPESRGQPPLATEEE